MNTTKIMCYLMGTLILIPTLSSADEPINRAYVTVSKTSVRNGQAQAGIHIEGDVNLHNSNEYWDKATYPYQPDPEEVYRAEHNRYKLDASIGAAAGGILDESNQKPILIGKFGIAVDMHAGGTVAAAGGNPAMLDVNQHFISFDPYAAAGVFVGTFGRIGAFPNGVTVRDNTGEMTFRVIPVGVNRARDRDAMNHFFTAVEFERFQKIVGGLQANLRAKAGVTYKGEDASGEKQLNLGVLAHAEAALRKVFSNGVYTEANVSVSDNIMKSVLAGDPTVHKKEAIELQGGLTAGLVY
jgi:hypothetical protein